MIHENIFRGGIGSVMGDRYVKSNENKKTMCFVANNLYRHSLSQPFSYDEIKFDRNVISEDILTKLHDSDTGYFFEVDLKYPEDIEGKTKNCPYCPGNEKKTLLIF